MAFVKKRDKRMEAYKVSAEVDQLNIFCITAYWIIGIVKTEGRGKTKESY